MTAIATEKTARLCLVGLSWLPSLAGQVAPEAAVAEGIRSVLEQLDAAFARRDAAEYAAAFAPDHPGAHALLRRSLERCFAHAERGTRTTTLLGGARRIGDHTAIHVRHDVVLHGDAHALMPLTTFSEEWLLALRPTGGGVWVPTLAVETAATTACVGDERFRCDACNYEIGGVAGWLCAPLRADRANALEAVSFYLLGTDVACDVAVQVDVGTPHARDVAQQLADTLFRLEPGAKPGLPAPWSPPAHAREALPGLHGAVVAVELPQDFGGAGGQAVFHVATFGGLQHLLLVRGSARALRERAAAVEALLASYRLLDHDADAARAAAHAVAHHTGGALDGRTYRNVRFGVELTGAPGWRPAMLTGGAAFRVLWTSEHGSRLWLTGYTVPPGMARWCRATANRWVEHQCERRGVDLLAAAAGTTSWADDAACGGTARTLVGAPRAASAAGSGAAAGPTRRWIRPVVRDDLLLVLDGYAANAEDEAELQQMLVALKRRR